MPRVSHLREDIGIEKCEREEKYRAKPCEVRKWSYSDRPDKKCLIEGPSQIIDLPEEHDRASIEHTSEKHECLSCLRI